MSVEHKKTVKNIVKLVTSIAVCEGVGFISSIFTSNAIPIWYTNLKKPDFTPPNAVFAPAWITLYLLMAIAAFLVWRKGLKIRGVRIALAIFVVQLVANFFWSFVFFGLRAPHYGIIVIIILWIAILATILTFYKVSKASGLLLIPYIAWVSFAAILNIAIWALQLS